MVVVKKGDDPHDIEWVRKEHVDHYGVDGKGDANQGFKLHERTRKKYYEP